MGVVSMPHDLVGVDLTQNDAVFFGTLGLSAIVGAGLALGSGVGAPPEVAHLELEADQRELERGGRVVMVPRTLDRPADEPLKVGLQCMERFDARVERHGKISAGSSQEPSMLDTLERVAWEEWVEVGAGERVAFDIPPHAPYSWEGDCLSFAWRAVVRERGADEAGGQRTLPIWVSP